MSGRGERAQGVRVGSKERETVLVALWSDIYHAYRCSPLTRTPPAKDRQQSTPPAPSALFTLFCSFPSFPSLALHSLSCGAPYGSTVSLSRSPHPLLLARLFFLHSPYAFLRPLSVPSPFCYSLSFSLSRSLTLLLFLFFSHSDSAPLSTLGRPAQLL
jgi:hypothetical protein